jgi:hypothetical protein
VPSVADEIVLTQGTVEERRLVAAYGQNGRIVAALAVNAPLLLPTYEALIEARAPFAPALNASDGPAELRPDSFKQIRPYNIPVHYDRIKAFKIYTNMSNTGLVVIKKIRSNTYVTTTKKGDDVAKYIAGSYGTYR